MNTQRYLLPALTGLSLALGSYSGSARADVTAKEVGHDVGQAAKTTVTYAEQEQDKYASKAQSEIDKLRAEIDQLGDKARTARNDVKAKLDRDIAALDRKRDVAENKLSDLKSADASAWKHLQAGVDSALNDLKQSFARARKDFN
ncbi:MAG: sll1863 family stress response protein [Sulfuricaulis sp.]